MKISKSRYIPNNYIIVDNIIKLCECTTGSDLHQWVCECVWLGRLRSTACISVRCSWTSKICKIHHHRWLVVFQFNYCICVYFLCSERSVIYTYTSLAILFLRRIGSMCARRENLVQCYLAVIIITLYTLRSCVLRMAHIQSNSEQLFHNAAARLPLLFVQNISLFSFVASLAFILFLNFLPSK